MCLESMVIIFWLTVHFCYSCKKLGVVCGADVPGDIASLVIMMFHLKKLKKSTNLCVKIIVRLSFYLVMAPTWGCYSSVDTVQFIKNKATV